MEKIDPIRAGFAWSGVFWAGTALTSWVSAGLLTLFVAGVSAAVTFILAERAGGGARPVSLAAALASGAFPLCLWASGEPGLMWAATLAVLLVASVLLLFKPSGGALNTGGKLVWLPFFVGLGLSYAVLIRQHAAGARLLLSAGLMLVAIKGSTLLACRMGVVHSGKAGGEVGALLPVRLAGVAAAEVAAMVSLVFLEEPFGPRPLAVLGFTVALAAMLGEATGRMIGEDLPEGAAGFPSLTAVGAWVMALPAFFYGFRLYLT